MTKEIEEFVIKSPREHPPISDVNFSEYIAKKFTVDNCNKTAIVTTIYLGVVFSPMTPANGPFEMSNHIHNARGTVLFVDRQRVEKILLPAMDNEKYCSAVKRT
ncbi:hypothetical protein HUG17_8429 [Dermatophagoides farinae]|uniref:Uncharacterized protein n=1 Tax=Dermatophagoides farinae TaxID=6954 RepID=A0A9D4SH75_DERFA|nr:hypothetical protein HUG17_8429 [Dermatophagoides farinae]